MTLNTVLINLYDGKRFNGSDIYVYNKQEIPVERMLADVLDYIKNNPRDIFNYLIVVGRVNGLHPDNIRVFGKDDVGHYEDDAPKFIISLVFFGESNDAPNELVAVLRSKIDQTMADCAAEAERKSAEIHQQKIKKQQLDRYQTYLQLKAEFES